MWKTSLAIICAAAGLLVSGCGETENPGTVLPLTDDTFDKAIAKGVVLVDFWGPWCEPCKPQRVIVAELAAETAGQKGLRFANINLGNETGTISRFDLEYVPTLILFKDGKPIKTFEGLTQKEDLRTALDEGLKR